MSRRDNRKPTSNFWPMSPFALGNPLMIASILMRPDKYLTAGRDKQNALGIELCTLRHVNRAIPIVVTWQEDTIRFWWWDEQNKKWQMIERKHRRLSDESKLPAGLSSWSERVACVPADDRVHL